MVAHYLETCPVTLRNIAARSLVGRSLPKNWDMDLPSLLGFPRFVLRFGSPLAYILIKILFPPNSSLGRPPLLTNVFASMIMHSALDSPLISWAHR